MDCLAHCMQRSTAINEFRESLFGVVDHALNHPAIKLEQFCDRLRQVLINSAINNDSTSLHYHPDSRAWHEVGRFEPQRLDSEVSQAHLLSQALFRRSLIGIDAEKNVRR